MRYGQKYVHPLPTQSQFARKADGAKYRCEQGLMSPVWDAYNMYSVNAKAARFGPDSNKELTHF